ncbi:PREDICTED: AP-4 complex subunit sigma-1-like [Priapulus caudatus]|uniref:AP complex subunit sigma n=1 Tax=Priapulus caudatus TaxID=37621 RepID=A0ABM1EEC0_PRICU|nr:PREDICTED: AP-4 complex subunit sigma-1-like [Priapulus caudatus]
MLKFLLIVNKQGHLRLSKFWCHDKTVNKTVLASDVIRNCLCRDEKQCSFLDYKDFKIIYRRYATLYFLIGADKDENELAVYEFIHNFVEVLNKYFKKVCELDVMYGLERVHLILDEMVSDGEAIEMNQSFALAPVQVLDAFGHRR